MRRPILTRRTDPDALASAIWAQVGQRDLDRRARGVLPADRRIRRADAERQLKRALMALEAEGRTDG